MINAELLEMLLSAPEGSRIEHKQEILKEQPGSLYEESEFIRDMISLANSGGLENAYLLIGLTNDGNLVDIEHLDLKDAELQQKIKSRVDPPIRFEYSAMQRDGISIGVIEIEKTAERPHMVSKDFNSQGPERERLRQGQMWIRDGSSKRPVGPWDILQYKEEYCRRNTAQPKLRVTFQGDLSEIPISASWLYYHHPLDAWLPCLPGGQPSTETNLCFEIHNDGDIEAKNVLIDIVPPEGMRLNLQRYQGAVIKQVHLQEKGTGFVLRYDSFIHGEEKVFESIGTTFNTDGDFYVEWTARAGNMTNAASGMLKAIVSMNEEDRARLVSPSIDTT